MFDKLLILQFACERLEDTHYIKIKVVGPAVNGKHFEVTTERVSRTASKGSVTSTATFDSFLSSVIRKLINDCLMVPL